MLLAAQLKRSGDGAFPRQAGAQSSLWSVPSPRYPELSWFYCITSIWLISSTLLTFVPAGLLAVGGNAVHMYHTYIHTYIHTYMCTCWFVGFGRSAADNAGDARRLDLSTAVGPARNDVHWMNVRRSLKKCTA